MVECKRCGSTQIVKSGTVRGKQRYMCKQCGYHFIEGDRRENSTNVLLMTICTLFQMLGAEQYRMVGEHLNRDTSLIHRWMNKTPFEYKRYWKGHAREYKDANHLFDQLKQGGVANGKPLIVADNVIEGMYIALIVQQRED